MIEAIAESGRIPCSVPGWYPDHLVACSPDRKSWRRLQVNGQSFDHCANGTLA
jgi:hypothetical protein